MTQKTSRLLLRMLGAGVIILIAACSLFLIRGQQKLLDLVNHRSQKSTDVYSDWLILAPGPTANLNYVLAMLQELGYESVSGPLQKSGQYTAGFGHVDIWTRGFEYPDESLPAQQLRLTYWGQQLSKIEVLPENRTVPTWRLEPKRYAQWMTKGGAAQPQVRIEDLPSYIPQSVIAIEDKRFFRHGAIDFRGLIRALLVDLRQGQLRQGGSTISQQLSRSIFLDVKRTWTRKLLEAGLAFYLEARYSKAQLLEMYLNQVYWGQEGADSLLGLESTSQSLFGKSARGLTLAESALLAGLLQSPNHYSPRADIKVAMQRRNLVLALMFNQGFITTDQFKSAIMEPLHLAPMTTHAGDASYFISTLQESLAQQYSLNALMTQGWRIYTTLDPVLQSYAVEALHPVDGQAAMVAIDPRNGAVRAWDGGTDYAKSSFDRVVYAKRQPGSAFKPFVMVAALDSRKANMATLLDDQRFNIKTPQGMWSPQNYDRKYRAKASLWDSLVYSLNIPTVHLAMEVGLDKVADYARRMGIQSPLREVPSLALGTSEVTILELTSAYATLANAGCHAVSYTIESILDPQGHIIQTNTPAMQDAVSADATYLVTQMLQAVLQEGTAKQARQLGFTYTAAGKTGTSENYQDAWFVGYTPQLACGVWVGYDQPRTLGHAAAGIALPLWVNFMQKALAVWPEESIPEPKDLVWKTIDVETGDLARSGCPHRRKEAFLPGTMPTQLCPVHPGGLLGFFYRLKGK